MNSKEIAASDLFLDRPLHNGVSFAESNPRDNSRALPDLADDRRAASLDSLFQFLLVVCLLSSLVICGWNLGNVSGFGSDAAAMSSQPSQAVVAPAIPAAAAANTVVTTSHQPAIPRACGALTVAARLF